MKGLDRYLMTEPDDGYQSWVERVIESFSDDFYLANEAEIVDCDSLISRLIDRHWAAGSTPEQTVQSIEQFINSL